MLPGTRHFSSARVIIVGPIRLIRFNAPFAIWIAYCFAAEYDVQIHTLLRCVMQFVFLYVFDFHIAIKWFQFGFKHLGPIAYCEIDCDVISRT